LNTHKVQRELRELKGDMREHRVKEVTGEPRKGYGKGGKGLIGTTGEAICEKAKERENKERENKENVNDEPSTKDSTLGLLALPGPSEERGDKSTQIALPSGQNAPLLLDAHELGGLKLERESPKKRMHDLAVR
jgi:hypothetical protein